MSTESETEFIKNITTTAPYGKNGTISTEKKREFRIGIFRTVLSVWYGTIKRENSRAFLDGIIKPANYGLNPISRTIGGKDLQKLII